MYVHVCRDLQWPKGGVRSSGAGVTAGCVLPSLSAGGQTLRSFAREICTRYH